MEPTELGKNFNLMAEHYYDPQLNAYEDGPGRLLPKACQSSAHVDNKANRIDCAIIVFSVPTILTERGLANLCKKFGELRMVEPVVILRRGHKTNRAFVFFTTSR